MRHLQQSPPTAAYQTADELSELIRLRELAIALLPDGTVRQSIVSELARLRRFAAEWHNVKQETVQ
jgi:hypothetical protein